MSTEESVMPTDDTTVSYGSSGILFNRETGYYTFDGFVIAQKLNNNVASYGAAGITSIAGFSAKADTLSGIIGLGINALQSIEFKDDEDELRDKALSISNVLNNALEQACQAEADDEEDYHNE